MTSSLPMRPVLASLDIRASPLTCRWVKVAVGRTPRRRCMVTAKKKDASEKVKKLQKLCDGVEGQLSVLRTELLKIKEDWEDQSMAAGQTQQLQSIALEILDRQEAYFKEERSHWINERAEWRTQETKLLQEIARLQGCIATSPENKPTKQITSTTTPMPHLIYNSENKTSSLITDATKNGEKTEKTSSVAGQNVQGSETRSNVGNSIAAAISAVDKVDVLSDDFQEYLKTTIIGAAETTDDAPIETVKSPPTGPPPSLAVGDDDIFWVHQLQEALVLKGYYCGDDDTEDYYFGEGTVSALLTFQACTGLKETGFVDESTWRALLGENMKPITDAPADIPLTETSNKQTADVSIEEPTDKHKAASSDDTTSRSTDALVGDGIERTEHPTQNQTDNFPVLSEFDGGKDVHCLQVMLEIAGFSSGKDDMQWWHYGDDTINAVKTFQACNGLPQSGVSDEKTWKLLAGTNKTMTDVEMRVKEENIYEEDLTQSDRVWLLGEQRWERKL